MSLFEQLKTEWQKLVWERGRGPLQGTRRRSSIGNWDTFERLEDRTMLSGASLVDDIYPGSASSNPRFLTNANGDVFFIARDGTPNNEPQLWVSNGTAAGTVPLTNLPNNAYVVANDAGSGEFGQYPGVMANVNGTLYFAVTDNSTDAGPELWKSDGTQAGTVMVDDFSSPHDYGTAPKFLTNVNGTLFFEDSNGTTGSQLWEANASGVTMVTDINSQPANGSPGIYPHYLRNMNGTLYFVADDGIHGRELWQSDGTAGGTVMVDDINPGSANSYPYGMTDVNGTVFFQANDGVHGLELWKTDGTTAGTALVDDIYPGSSGSSPAFLTNVNGMLFFHADPSIENPELFVSNGTAAGTVPLVSNTAGVGPGGPVHLINANGELFFAAEDAHSSNEIWKSNGTLAGTVLVDDIADTSPGSGIPSTYLANVNGTVFFSDFDGIHGSELWATNGTAAGTALVDDIYPGSGTSIPRYLTNVNGTLFFSANDGTHGVELWSAQPPVITGPQAPSITSAASASFTAGSAGNFTVTDSGSPVPTIAETGTLPSGVTFNPTTGLLAGTAVAGAGGTYNLTFTATNGVGQAATQTFTLTVDEAPSITSSASASIAIGTATNFSVTSTGFPNPTFAESGTLPAGITFSSATGALSGTASVGTNGTYNLTFTASNGIGQGASQNFTLTVGQAPAFVTGNTTSFAFNTPGTFTVTATGSPTPTLNETGALPSGMTFDASTGIVSGTPATAGFFTLTFTASNGIGQPVQQNFTLTVAPPVIHPDGTADAPTAFTTGDLILAFLFNLSNTKLQAFVNANSTESITDIRTRLAAIQSNQLLDVDGNGSITPFTDGDLILAFLFGLPDSKLHPFIGAGATRTLPEIKTYLGDLFGKNSSPSTVASTSIAERVVSPLTSLAAQPSTTSDAVVAIMRPEIISTQFAQNDPATFDSTSPNVATLIVSASPWQTAPAPGEHNVTPESDSDSPTGTNIRKAARRFHENS